MEQFVILGSSNAVPKLGQENTHLFIESAEKKILVDCGDNPLGKMTAIGKSVNEISDLVLTHFHADHVGSLPLLIMGMWLEKRETPLMIHGLNFTLERARQLLELFTWQKWPDMFPVEFNTLPENGVEGFIKGSGISITAKPVLHLVPTIGLRFEFASGRIVTYSCDTEPCENLYSLAAGAEVLLQESAGATKGHTSALQAGEIAEKCGVKKLILIHYEKRMDEKILVADARKGFSGEVLAATDLMTV
jgi:ribonuclease Z